jgi:hypothetical protein
LGADSAPLFGLSVLVIGSVISGEFVGTTVEVISTVGEAVISGVIVGLRVIVTVGLGLFVTEGALEIVGEQVILGVLVGLGVETHATIGTTHIITKTRAITAAEIIFLIWAS